MLKCNLQKLYDLMDFYKIDAVLVTDPSSLKYLGFNMWFSSVRDWMMKAGGDNSNGYLIFCLIPFKKEPVYILDSMAMTFLEEDNFDNVIIYNQFAEINKKDPDFLFSDLENKVRQKLAGRNFLNFIEALEYALKINNLVPSKLAFEMDGINSVLMNDIQEKFKECKFYNGSELIRLTRMIKTSLEIDILKKCFNLTEDALLDTIQKVKPGIVLEELINNYNHIINENNATMTHFIVAPYGLGITERRDYNLKDNMIMGFDLGAIYKNYISDAGFTVFLGNYSKIDFELYKKLLDILDTGFKKIKPGARCSEIYNAVIDKKNYYNMGNIFFTGHGVGLSFREYPLISGKLNYNYDNGFEKVNADFYIEKYMVINLEISLYDLGYKTLHIEKTVYVVENGFKDIVNQNRTIPLMIH